MKNDWQIVVKLIRFLILEKERAMKFEIKWKRAYEKIEKADGFRILVDKLWPRGLKKEDAKIDYWAKIITPSKELRQNYHKGIIDFENFSENYRKELEGNSDFKEFEDVILEELKKGNVTMVYASKTPELSHIPVLKEFIKEIYWGKVGKIVESKKIFT